MPVLFLCSYLSSSVPGLWHDVHAWCCSRKVQLIFLPPGTCPTASYKFQPWNQICCELCRRVVQGVTFFITLASIIGETALPFHDSTHLFILPSTVTNYLHQQNGAHKEWPPAESMSKFMLTGSCGNSELPQEKKKGSDEIEAHKQLSWSFSLRPIWSMACSWYWTLSAIATCQQKKRTQHWHIMFSFSNTDTKTVRERD